MSIDPQLLRAVSHLLLGTAFSPDQCDRLATTLGVVEEVLPWFCLRQNAFKAFPNAEESLAAAAQKIPFPSSKRDQTRVFSRTILEHTRELEVSIAAVVSNNILHDGLALKADALTAQIVRFTAFEGSRGVTVRAVTYSNSLNI